MSVEPRRPDVEPVDDAAMVGALQALPSVSPATDLWPDLAARLAARRRPSWRQPAVRMRRHWPLAAAATALMAVLLVASLPGDRSPGPALTGVTATSSEGDVDSVDGGREPDLVARSQWLERLVDSPALAPVVVDGDQALLEHGLRARIVDIDAALVDEPEQPQLWRARVSALGELAELRWAGRRAGLVSTAGVGSEDVRLQWLQ